MVFLSLFQLGPLRLSPPTGIFSKIPFEVILFGMGWSALSFKSSWRR